MSVRSSYVCDLTQLLTVGGLSYCPEVTNFGAVPRLPRLPDLLTTANLCCGVLSILLASQGQLTIACGLIFLAAVFDVFDGLAARALGGGSPLGAQLDSLADMVSFGVAPAFMVFSISDWPGLVPAFGALTHGTDSATWAFSRISWGETSDRLRLIAPIVIATASAWRLAKFNLDTRQTSGFLGLPTPANGLFWACVPLSLATGLVNDGPSAKMMQFFLLHLASPVVSCIVTIVLGILMLSELPLPSLKFKHFRWKGNEVIYCLLGIGLVLVVLYGILAVPLILVIYLLSPLWGKLFHQVTRSK